MQQQPDTSLYTASMAYTEETLHTFTAMQYNLFRKKQKYIAAGIAFILIVTGLVLGVTSWKGVLPLLIGCVVITNLLTVPKHIANRLLARFNGRLPSLNYRFHPDRMDVSTSGVPVHYKSLLRMEDDKKYLYLFVSEENGYMIDKSSVEGENGYAGLARLLESQTGKTVHRYSSLFSVSLLSLLKDLRSGRS